jgi:hypothetical protein
MGANLRWPRGGDHWEQVEGEVSVTKEVSTMAPATDKGRGCKGTCLHLPSRGAWAGVWLCLSLAGTSALFNGSTKLVLPASSTSTYWWL